MTLTHYLQYWPQALALVFFIWFLPHIFRIVGKFFITSVNDNDIIKQADQMYELDLLYMRGRKARVVLFIVLGFILIAAMTTNIQLAPTAIEKPAPVEVQPEILAATEERKIAPGGDEAVAVEEKARAAEENTAAAESFAEKARKFREANK